MAARETQIRTIIDAKYAGYADRIVGKLRIQRPDLHELGSIAISSRTSGEASPWPDVWEEYKVQVQGEQSAYFEAYEDTFHDMCERFIDTLDHPEIELLWLGSDAYDEWDSGEREQPGLAEKCERAISSSRLRRRRRASGSGPWLGRQRAAPR